MIRKIHVNHTLVVQGLELYHNSDHNRDHNLVRVQRVQAKGS